MIKKIECIHCGQYRMYGDSYYEFLISADNSEEKELIEECLSNTEILKYGVNPETNIINKGGRMWKDNINDYFKGFCWIEKSHQGDYNFKFTYVFPYAD